MPSGQLLGRTLVSFQGFTIDVERLSLHRGADRIPLTPTPFKVLSYLAQRPGIAVSKEELLEAVWGEKRESNTVEQTVRQVRRALGDDKGLPRFIQTIAGQGYCFIAKIDDSVQPNCLENPSAHADETSASPESTARGPRLPKRYVLFVGIMALGALLIGYLLLRQAARSALSAEDPIGLTRSETHILSPLQSDGTRILYLQYENGRYRIKAMPVSGGESQEVVTGLANPELCDLSGDGKLMLLRDLIRSRDEDEPLYISTGNGSAKKVGQILAYDAAWFPGDKHILYSSNGDVFAIDLKGQSPHKLFTVPGNAFWFRWSPDGKRLRFTVISKTNEETSIWEVAASGQSAHRLFSDLHYHLCCGTWTPDGKNFLFQARVRNTFEIWAERNTQTFVRLLQTAPYPVVSGAMSYRSPLPSTDGSKLFVRAEDIKGELVGFDTRLGGFNSILPSISARTIAFSRDGKWLAYTSLRDNNLWRCHVDGSDCVPLTRDFKNTVMPSWSPDGRTIAFMGLTFTGKWQVYVIPAEGGQDRKLSMSDQAKGYADWSHDGERIFFSDVPPVSQPRGIYVLEVQTQKIALIPGSTEFFYPRVSPDGRSLLAQHSGDLSLYMYEFASREWHLIANIRAWYPTWSRDGKYVYFRNTASEGPVISRVAVASGVIEEVASLAHVDRGPFFMGDWVGLTPDDQPIAVRNATIEGIYAWDLVSR